MHLVFLNQYYPPDVAPTGLMLEAVAECLAANGHEVTILCAEGGYGGGATPDALKPQKPGMRVVRIKATGFGRGSAAGKLADYLTFYVGVAAKLATLQPKPDRVVALTTPPYLSVLARWFSKFRVADHAHWVMDLYPDVMWAHGIIRQKSLPGSILSWLARWGMGGSRCRLVLTLGPDMAERTASYLTNRTPSAWVPLWGTAVGDHPGMAAAGDPSPHPPAPGAPREGDCSTETPPPTRRPLRLMYSGNMGLGHRFGEFLHGARTAGDRFEWYFNGDGKRRREIAAFRASHPDAPVTLSGYVPRALLAAHLASADVHLASLEPGWDGTMVPSKLQGIFAIGRPVIFVGSETSSMARWIHESGGGWVIPPDDRAALLAALAEALDEPARAAKGRAALAFATRYFGRDGNSTRIAKLLSTPAA
jgi:glycosyltransferase involved in cell wall biosynthesis